MPSNSTLRAETCTNKLGDKTRAKSPVIHSSWSLLFSTCRARLRCTYYTLFFRTSSSHLWDQLAEVSFLQRTFEGHPWNKSCCWSTSANATRMMGSASATEMAFEIAFKRARRRTSNCFPFCRKRLNQKGHQRKAHLLISPGKGSYEMPLSSNRLQKIVRKWNKENLGNMEDIHKLGLVQNCFYIVPNGITTARDHSDGGVLQNFNFIFQRTGRCMLSHKGQIDADRHIQWLTSFTSFLHSWLVIFS